MEKRRHTIREKKRKLATEKEAAEKAASETSMTESLNNETPDTEMPDAEMPVKMTIKVFRKGSGFLLRGQ